LKEAQKGLNRELKTYISAENPTKIRQTVIDIVSETLAEPRGGALEGVSDTVNILVNDYVRESDVIKNLLSMSYMDYSIVLHSVNVMAFAMGYAFHMDYPRDETKELGLCALLHDVGKTKINQHLLAAPRKLTDQEFEEIKSHTTLGFRLLKECAFVSKNIALVALEHHEKLDGSGYPQGKTKISEPAKIIGLIDCYEALTTDERPYREAAPPFDTLEEVIATEVKAGKFDKDVYVEFVKSLGGALQGCPAAGRSEVHSSRPVESMT
jgi:HD-GYP domain-containing protein (c-di-GMP phosphodiesterase class II)